MTSKQAGASELVVEPLLADKEEEVDFVSDGSLSYTGLPANKSKTGGVRSSFYIYGYHIFSQAALAVSAINLVLYTTKVLHLDNISAVLIGTNYVGATFLTSFFSGIFTDGYVGRYRAAGMFLSVFVVLIRGILICRLASTGQLLVFFVSLFLIAVGHGGSEPCAITFGADQYDEGDTLELNQKSSFFKWQAVTYSSTFIVYIEDNVGYGIGFAICTLLAIASTCSFFAGTPIYRFKRPGGNPFSRVSCVILAAAYKWKVQLPDDDNFLYEVNDYNSFAEAPQKRKHSKKLRFLDKAAAITEQGTMDEDEHSPWHLCTVTQVEEVKSLFNLLPVSLTTLIYCTVHVQIFTLFVTQGITMDQRVGNFQVPPASLVTFNNITSVVFTAAYELALIPLIRKFSSTAQGMTTVTRIVVGLAVSVLAMVIASLVEQKRLKIVEKYDLFENLQVPMNIFWQVPQYCLVGLSEVFAYVGLTEFYYVESPDALRGAGASFSMFWVALGSFLSSLSVTVVARLTSHDGQPGWIANNLNKGHLNYFFLLLAAVSALNVLFTIACVHSACESQEPLSNGQNQKESEPYVLEP